MYFVEGIHDETIPMYDDWLEEACALQAFLIGDYGSLTLCEIEWMKDAARECGVLPALPLDIADLPAPKPIKYI